MDETKVIDDAFRWSLFSPVRISHAAPFSPIDVVIDESDDSGSSLAELKGHERDKQDDQEKPGSSVAELRGGESSPPSAEAEGDHSDGEHEEKTEMVDDSDEGDEDNSGEITAVESSIGAELHSGDSRPYLADIEEHGRDDLELRVGGSSPPPPEAEGDHPDGEDEDKTEIPGLPSYTSSAAPRSTRSANQDNDTEDDRVSALDISTMKMAIKSGDPKAVDDLMKRLSDTQAVDELTTTYGGRGYSWSTDEDEDGLFRGTSPILHAAKSGNMAVFESVMEAMEAKLSREQVKDMLVKTDIQRQSLLSLAARSGSKDVLEGIILVIQQELTEYEVKSLISSRSKYGYSLLSLAVERGSVEMFKAVVVVVVDNLLEQEVKSMILSRSGNSDSLLSLAVRSNSVEMFKAVMVVLVDNLLEQEVKSMISSRSKFGDSLLSLAVMGKSTEMFKAVMVVVVDNFSEQEVKSMLSSRTVYGYSLLSLAVERESVEMFKTVMVVVVDDLLEQEVKSMISSRTVYGFSLPSLAVMSKSVEMFNVVMVVVVDNLLEQEVKSMISSRTVYDNSLLSLAVRSKSVEMFKAVMVVVVDNLLEQEVKSMISSRSDRVDPLLSLAIMSESVGMFKAVMVVVVDNLLEQEVKRMISSRNKYGYSLLSSAVMGKSVEMFKAVMVVVVDNLLEQEVKSLISSRTVYDYSLLSLAVMSKSVEMFKAVTIVVVDSLLEHEVKRMISSRSKYGYSLLSSAVMSKSVEMFKAVMVVVVDNLLEQEVKSMISSRSENGYSLLSLAVINKSVEMFKAVMVVVVDNLLEQEVKELGPGDSDGGCKMLLMAIRTGRVEIFKVVMTTIHDKLTEEEVVKLLCMKDRYDEQTPLGLAITKGKLDMCEIVLRSVQDYLGHKRMQDELDAAFLWWKSRYEEDRSVFITSGTLSKILSMLLKHSARPPTEFLQWIARDVTDGKENLWPVFTESLLIGVESASNPLVPGMNLSVPLTEAAEGAREGERTRLISLQERVDNYVLEVLERLPQTIQGFEKGTTQCSALFEPEGPENDPCGRPGPLRVAFERRDQMQSLCAVPLVMDYLSRRFTSGLPDMRDSGRVLQDRTALSRLAENDVGGLVLGGTEYSILRQDLQGANASRPSLTILPGAQFIIAGLLAKPSIYYRVPAMRMALEFVVYIMILLFYSFWVLLYEEGPLTTEEILFAFYVLAGVFTEAAEARRDLKIYLQYPWNFFNALALVMLAGGFFVRFADGGSPWGRALYALSAPLVFSRILFFVQILQFQGPMIQVMFSMGKVLLQFAVVLLVVMMGFAMALYTLLRDDNSLTFNAILLLLFKTLLGDVEAFEEFDDSTQNSYSTVGRLTLAVYLVVMTITLLNLLIAVLSTKHAELDVNADKEFKVSRARIVEHYRLAVAFDIVPAPFNLLQLVLTLMFLRKGQSAAYTKTMEAVGQVAFWLVLSPLVFAGGVVLWVTSSMYSICQTPQLLLSLRTSSRTSSEGTPYNLLEGIFLFFWCTLGAPLCLLGLWLRQPFLSIGNVVIPSTRRQSQGERDDWNPFASASGHKESGVDVQKMLKVAGTEASDLRKYLEDPMCDPKVRPDEVDRGTTVKHMKLLRDRLEQKFNERVDHLGVELKKRIDLSGVEFNERVDHLDKKYSEYVNHLEKKFDERVDSLETSTNALGSETSRKVELVLEMLRGK